MVLRKMLWDAEINLAFFSLGFDSQALLGVAVLDVKKEKCLSTLFLYRFTHVSFMLAK